MIHPVFDAALCTQVISALDLRQPNADALETIAKLAEQRLEAEDSTFEGVVDVATGVGKTYILAAAIDYFTALGYRSFAVITPGRTIARKTIANFTPGHPKSLLRGMETRPRVITSENFATPDAATAMDDEGVAKVFIFTVQALLTPTSKADRKTHEFQEDLGEGFYEKLAATDDLVVFADEHHVYGGKKFDAAVRGLKPRILLGFTATPLKGAPVIFRFPLPAAIAGGYVKTPVMVGRRDDRKDFLTKLTDGARLLDAKQLALNAWRTAHPELPVIHAVMLVIAQNTDDATEAEAILRHPNFHAGNFIDATLTIHSAVDDVEKALVELDAVEEPDSRVRAIVSVGMLKEGWDVKNVYVVCSLRASVSQILTEQTLGRGLRLPYGKPTGNEMLDTLEVVAHDRFEALVEKVDKLREEFVDWKTIAAADAEKAPPISEAASIAGVIGKAIDGGTTTGTAVVADIDDRIAHNDAAAAEIAVTLVVRPNMPALLIPVVTSTPVDSPFGLQDITDLEPFRAEGRRFAANPEDQLRRTVLEAKVVKTDKGRTTQFIRRTATDKILSAGQSVSDADLIARLAADVINTGDAVPPRPGQKKLLAAVIDAFVEGLGKDNVPSLAAYDQRAAAAIVALIRTFRADKKPQINLDDNVTLKPFAETRIARPATYPKGMPFARGAGYVFDKSLFDSDWFDGGSTEFALAHLLDDNDEIAYWLRLQTSDLPLGWAGDARAYNPDFIAVDAHQHHWVIEGKADDAVKDADVIAKRLAATRWAAHVTANTGVAWHYLLARETDIETAKSSWEALKKLAGA